MLRPVATALILAAIPLAAHAQQPAAEEAKPVTKAELTKELDSDYADLDANKDGKVDAEEIKARLNKSAEEQLSVLRKERDAAFAKFDTNGDGTISRAEFDSKAQLPEAPKADAAPFLARFDANKDGEISADEFRAPTLANFAKMDANKDGTLSLAEQKAAVAPKVKPKTTPPIGR